MSTTFERYQLVRPIAAKGLGRPAERVNAIVGGQLETFGPDGVQTRRPTSLEALPDDYTHEVWAKQPPAMGGAWQFEYGGRVDDCIRYLRYAIDGARIWEFSIRPLAFAYFTEE